MNNVTGLAPNPSAALQARYNKVTGDVTTLNEQINELLGDNESMEGDIETLETRIRHLRKAVAQNVKRIEKMRAKRLVIAQAAFQTSILDQP